jgi:hypothetical protein
VCTRYPLTSARTLAQLTHNHLTFSRFVTIAPVRSGCITIQSVRRITSPQLTFVAFDFIIANPHHSWPFLSLAVRLVSKKGSKRRSRLGVYCVGVQPVSSVSQQPNSRCHVAPKHIYRLNVNAFIVRFVLNRFTVRFAQFRRRATLSSSVICEPVAFVEAKNKVQLGSTLIARPLATGQVLSHVRIR